MIESLDFYYNGISSQIMGVIQVSQSTGFYEDKYIATKNLVEQKVRGKDTPYLFDIEREPISFPLRLWFTSNLTETKMRDITNWLDQDYYKEFYFTTSPSRIMYGMFQAESTFVHNGLKQGYINLQFKTNSPYFYSPVTTDAVLDYSTNSPSGTELIFNNNGDVVIQPILTLTKTINNGDITITNKTNNNVQTTFTGLSMNEVLTIDNEKETIDSNIVGTYRYSNHNGNFLQLVKGQNKLQIYGNCKIQLKYQFKFRNILQ